MLKGEVHERFTETFLLGLKQGFIDASIKTVSVFMSSVYARQSTYVVNNAGGQFANNCCCEHVFSDFGAGDGAGREPGALL